MTSSNLLFLDIETVLISKTVPDLYENHVAKKAVELGLSSQEWWDNDAFKYAEFSQIVCIAIGHELGGEFIKGSIIGEEKQILRKLFMTIGKPEHMNKSIIAHNGQLFDYPHIIKRSLYHDVELDRRFKILDIKPWESKLKDTYQMYKFGGMNSGSLDFICNFLDIPTPKDSISGADVQEKYDEGKIEEIAEYCVKDIVALWELTKKLSKASL